jgi:predicted metal-binding protein
LILEKHLVDDKLLVVQHNALEVQHKMHWKCSTKCVGSAAQNALIVQHNALEVQHDALEVQHNALKVQHKMRWKCNTKCACDR